MATRNYAVIARDPGAGSRDTLMIRWDGLLNGDDGQPLDLAAYADRSIQVLGTLGAGGNARMLGSLLPAPSAAISADWATLTDPQGNALDVNALKIEAVSEATRWFRPQVTAGDGTTSLTVILLAIRK